MPVTSSVTVASFAAIRVGANNTAVNTATAAITLRVLIDTSGADYTAKEIVTDGKIIRPV